MAKRQVRMIFRRRLIYFCGVLPPSSYPANLRKVKRSWVVEPTRKLEHVCVLSFTHSPLGGFHRSGPRGKKEYPPWQKNQR